VPTRKPSIDDIRGFRLLISENPNGSEASLSSECLFMVPFL